MSLLKILSCLWFGVRTSALSHEEASQVLCSAVKLQEMNQALSLLSMPGSLLDQAALCVLVCCGFVIASETRFDFVEVITFDKPNSRLNPICGLVVVASKMDSVVEV